MSLASELVATIRAQIAELALARVAIAGARNSIAEVLMEVEQQTDGTSDSRPAEAITRYQVGLEALEAAEKEIAASEQALEVYVAHLMGSGGGAPASATVATKPRSGVTPSTPKQKDPPRSPVYNPERGEPIKQYVDRGKTVGILYAPNEEPSEEIWSGTEGPAKEADELKSPWAEMSTMRQHTEGHAASIMRTEQIKDAELYINRPVCDYVPYGCVFTLADVLPADSRLVVYDVSQPRPRPMVFKGNGKGIKSADG